MHVNRREFLRKSICAALGGASLYSALGNLRLVQAATNQTLFSDYKALVCIFLYGGNDSLNTLVPTSGIPLTNYKSLRGGLAQTTGLHALTPLAGGGASDSANYALHPGMPELATLFNSGKAAVVANVGTLLYPTSQLQFQNGSIAVPPQLLSHNDQQSQWQTSRPDDASANGWGGRVADLLHSGNSGQIPMSVSVSGTNLFQRGSIVNQYGVDPSGVTAMNYLGDGSETWIIGDGPIDDDVTAYNALIASGTQSNVLERAFADVNSRAITNYQLVTAALQSAPTLTTQFPNTDLGNQLAMVAKLISVRSALGMSRQVFFVSTGNYDTHSDQIENQQDNLSELSQAVSAFYNATTEPALNVANNVTTFTASDFGRSLQANSSGTDHGWGGHHFVVGGAVRGQRFYGTMPSLASNKNPDDTGYGQIIPTLAVDQYAATLATWFGVASGDLATVFPNLGRFSSANLGFV
ncbi:MAG TPA: DUF1501 domain-containing protein [Rudaea sp.]|jgi:uncharacterized protein (DUF1501 family)|nr:DUF1501 domain-containing protein [Rudaea sp.]